MKFDSSNGSSLEYDLYINSSIEIFSFLLLCNLVPIDRDMLVTIPPYFHFNVAK